MLSFWAFTLWRPSGSNLITQKRKGGAKQNTKTRLKRESRGHDNEIPSVLIQHTQNPFSSVQKMINKINYFQNSKNIFRKSA